MINSTDFQPVYRSMSVGKGLSRGVAKGLTRGRRRYWSLALTTALLIGGLAPPSHAAELEPAGTVAAARGQVTAAGADGSIRELRVNDPVFAGDIISTGPNSRVRLQFTDNGLVALRPESRFVIDEYEYADDPELDRNAFSLVRGGFRAVTGAVGQNDPDNYQLETPVATIGIRGTEHTGRFCAGDCFDLADIGVAAPPDGLYTGTLSGRTVVGNLEFQDGEYGYTDPAGITVQLPEPPPILTADPHLQDVALDEEEPEPEEEAPVEEPDEPEEVDEEPDEPEEEVEEPLEEAPEEAPEEPPEEAPTEQPDETPAEAPEEAPAEAPAPEQPPAAEEPDPPAEAPDAPPPPAPPAPEPDDDFDDGFEIPARPPTVREVDC